MDKTKEEYEQFLRHAIEDRKSNEYIELYQFLLQCFIRADDNMDGMVTIDEFDQLLESATALPQEHGYVKSSKELYPTTEARKEARAKLFKEMDENNDGHISFEEWLAFAISHGIMGDINQFQKFIMSGKDVTKEEYAAFVKKAAEKTSSEYRQFFWYLLKCFSDADADKDGAVQPSEFTLMMELAAAADRRHGVTSTLSTVYANDAERDTKYSEYFKSMDENNDGNISLEEWVKFCFNDLVKKAAAL